MTTYLADKTTIQCLACLSKGNKRFVPIVTAVSRQLLLQSLHVSAASQLFLTPYLSASCLFNAVSGAARLCMGRKCALSWRINLAAVGWTLH